MLFHYNGHGVPKPTNNGEIWVFNSHYTKYIPLPIYELQSWIGNPVIYVFDCPSAGTIVNSIKSFIEHDCHNLVFNFYLLLNEMYSFKYINEKYF